MKRLFIKEMFLHRRVRFALLLAGVLVLGYKAHAVKVLFTEPDHFGYLYHHGGHEVRRYTSPDQRLDAVVYRLETDSLSEDIYYLHIFPQGIEPKTFDVRSAAAVLVSRGQMFIHWSDPFHLQVNTGTATLSFFTNVWAPPSENLPFVEIILVSNRPVLKPDGSFNY